LLPTTPTSPGGPYASTDFYTDLSPFYVKVLPTRDQWGTFYQAYCGLACEGIHGATNAGGDDFLIFSLGRDKLDNGFVFDDTNPEAGLFVVNQMVHFNYDLIMWNGSWIRAPRTAAAGS
jgi:hypothetical protein